MQFTEQQYIFKMYNSKKNWKITFNDKMDGTGEYDAKWNKPACERQIPYNLTYNRNLMNKTN